MLKEKANQAVTTAILIFFFNYISSYSQVTEQMGLRGHDLNFTVLKITLFYKSEMAGKGPILAAKTLCQLFFYQVWGQNSQ